MGNLKDTGTDRWLPATSGVVFRSPILSRRAHLKINGFDVASNRNSCLGSSSIGAGAAANNGTDSSSNRDPVSAHQLHYLFVGIGGALPKSALSRLVMESPGFDLPKDAPRFVEEGFAEEPKAALMRGAVWNFQRRNDKREYFRHENR